MAEYVPLLQTLAWIGLIIGGSIFLRSEIRALRVAFAKRLSAGSSVRLGSVLELGEVRQEVAAVREDVDRISANVGELFLLTMSDAMFLNLSKLETGTFGHFERNQGLEAELRHLRNVGYIRVASVRSIPDEGPELCAHVEVTEPGRAYVRMRQDLLASRAAR